MLAVLFGTQVDLLRDILRIAVLVLPVVVGVLTFFLCRRLAGRMVRRSDA